MSRPYEKYFGLEASLDRVPEYHTVNKFGEAPDCDTGEATDVWDGADGSTGTKIWAPPTQARAHQIVSTSANDTSAGTGARTVKIYGLLDWDSAESCETVTLNGTTNVPTANQYVIIYRMKVTSWGSGGVNAGVITATADTDATVTSAILAGNNQTQMAIFGIPSNQYFRVTKFQVSIVKGSGGSQRADGNVLYMPDPATYASDNTAWVNKESFQVLETNLPWQHDYANIPKKFNGPGILKLQVTSDSNGTKCTALFDGYLTYM